MAHDAKLNPWLVHQLKRTPSPRWVEVRRMGEGGTTKKRWPASEGADSLAAHVLGALEAWATPRGDTARYSVVTLDPKEHELARFIPRLRREPNGKGKRPPARKASDSDLARALAPPKPAIMRDLEDHLERMGELNEAMALSVIEQQQREIERLHQRVLECEALNNALMGLPTVAARVTAGQLPAPAAPPRKADKPKRSGGAHKAAGGAAAVPARAEVTLKFDALPTPVPVPDDAKRVELRLSAGPFVFAAKLRNKAINKAKRVIDESPAWVASLSGKVGPVSGQVIEVEEASLQVFGRKTPSDTSVEPLTHCPIQQ